MATMTLILKVMFFSLVFTVLGIQQIWGEYDCYGEKELVKQKCKINISMHGDYIRPGHECCVVVKKSDMVCVCRVLTKDEERIIGAAKLVRVARDCGKPVPGGNNCGTFALPKPPPPPRSHPYKSSPKRETEGES